MSSSFPSIIASLTNPSPTDRLNSPSHSSIETAQNVEITQIETIIGTTASALGTIIGDLRNANSPGGGHVQTAIKGGTGQTTYTKGDILVAQSSSVLAKLAVGQDGAGLVADSSVASGVKWGSFPATPTVRVYSSVVTIWRKPSVLSYIVVECVGGGGGGAGANVGASSSATGGGGGGGGYARKTILASALPLAASVFAGPPSVMSYFGSILSAIGGSNGIAEGAGGGGGYGVGGDINCFGSGGGTGSGETAQRNKTGPSGGNSYFGGGGRGGLPPTENGTAGGLYGGGGGGGCADNSNSAAGGAGADGIVIVYEY